MLTYWAGEYVTSARPVGQCRRLGLFRGFVHIHTHFYSFHLFYSFIFSTAYKLTLISLLLFLCIRNTLLSYLGSFSVGIDSATNGRFSNWAGHFATFNTQMTAFYILKISIPIRTEFFSAKTVNNSAYQTSSCNHHGSDATNNVRWCFLFLETFNANVTQDSVICSR